MSRTRNEIQEELHLLNELHGQVPENSILGDNHEAIHAQIKVITDDMTQVEILAEWEEGDPYVLSAALDALSWMRDDGDPASEGWLVALAEHPTLAA